MPLSFWSLGKFGLFPVSGRPSWRAFRAAVSVCGLPRLCVSLRDASGWSLGPDGRWSRSVCSSVSLEFSGRGLFRCWFRQSQMRTTSDP